MLEFYPTGWCVLMKSVKKEGSVITLAGQDGQDPTCEYVVLRVGEKVTTLKEGDIIVAGERQMVRAKFRGQTVFVQDERNLWCVARENPKAKKAVEGLTVIQMTDSNIGLN